MARTIEETTAWVAQTMAKKQGVLGVEKVGERSIRISREDYPPYVAGIVSKLSVSAQDVRDVLASDPTVDIVINVPSHGIWTGSAIEVTRAAGVAFGGMGDLQSCIAKEDPRAYVKSEFAFIERALRQHTKVSGITREADRLFLVHRHGAGDVRVLALYEYELTGEHLRTARERYSRFDLVLISNPNGKPTGGAKSVAEELQVETYMLGGLLGRLNRP
ncbi:hypothetical protein HA052_22215 [Chromobacterium haemolyticum]|uniref:Uncharacterized protein n=1 Tax=Chromobacterium fluminis TaxID=3044269 RepID=A0ABX0L7W4_9NEIS|nr:hypothetical protein [Chromobacterium haemolyticum]NHR07912.1 hypothetical protein [Chromobacterium haemolyticum]